MPPDAAADGGDLLVCVYYRVGPADADLAIGRVREFQRTLQRRFPGTRAEVLLRSDQNSPRAPDAVPTAPADPSEPLRAGHLDADATLMETYRLALPAAGTQAFLAELAACASTLAGLLRGERHAELFRPCA